MAEAVLDDELDLAYVLGWQVPTNVRYEPLHQTRFTLLVARSDPRARAATVTAAQIARAGLITAPLDDVEWVRATRGRARRVNSQIGGRRCRRRSS